MVRKVASAPRASRANVLPRPCTSKYRLTAARMVAAPEVLRWAPIVYWFAPRDASRPVCATFRSLRLFAFGFFQDSFRCFPKLSVLSAGDPTPERNEKLKAFPYTGCQPGQTALAGFRRAQVRFTPPRPVEKETAWPHTTP